MSQGERLRSLTSPTRGKARVALDQALDAVRAESGIDFSHCDVRAGLSRGHLIDVIVKLPGGNGSHAEREAARGLVARLLGEAREHDWLGEVLVEPAPRGGLLKVLDARTAATSTLALAELPATFERAVDGIRAGLPERPYWALGGEQLWTMLEASAERADDYSAQDDVVLSTTFLPEMLKCFLRGARFASARFSRHGELFGYLKTESRSRDPRLSLAARRVLEDALDAALVTERSGRVVGSGVGVRYFYVDLALSDVDRAVDVMREVAARVGLSKRSWILFFDTALSEEWLPVHAGGPEPP